MIEGILRKRLGFDGIVITDDVGQAAAADDRGGVLQALSQDPAIAAGIETSVRRVLATAVENKPGVRREKHHAGDP